jgi:ERCC4-type nuclease
MHRFYKTPVLLVEFDEHMPFKLEDHTFPTDYVSGGDLSIVAIFSKLSMLAVNFPGLQILWSTGPAHTAEIFYQIKRAEQAKGVLTDPDLHKIIRIGKVAD